MAEHSLASPTFNQGLFAISGNNQTLLTTVQRPSIRVRSLRFYAAGLLFGEASLGHRGSVCQPEQAVVYPQPLNATCRGTDIR